MEHPWNALHRGSGPVTVRHAEPDVPMPAPVAAPAPDRDPRSRRPTEPTERQRRCWEAYHRHGGQGAAAKALGCTQGSVRSGLLGYMAAAGLEGPIPPADPSLFPPAPDRLVLAPDPAPIDMHRPIAPPPPDERSDWSAAAERHAAQAPQVLEDLTSTDQASDRQVTAAPTADQRTLSPEAQHPRTGGAAATSPATTVLSRLERELDRLALEDAALVAQARVIVEQRTDVARRIEEVRTAGAVFRRVMGA